LAVKAEKFNCSINQVFIPSTMRDQGMFLFGCGTKQQQKNEFNERMVLPAYSWISSKPAFCQYNLWVDVDLIDEKIIEKSASYLCDKLEEKNIDTSSLFMKDIRELNDIKEHPKVFEASKPILPRSDAARLSILIHEVARGLKYAIYADLDKIGVPFEHIFNDENSETIQRYGFVLHRPQENRFAPWPNFMLITENADRAELQKYIDRALYEMENFRNSKTFTSFVQTLVTLWYVAQERPELIDRMLTIRQEIFELQAEYSSLLLYRLRYYYKMSLSKNDINSITGRIKENIKNGDGRNLIIEKIIGSEAYQQLVNNNPYHVAWFLSDDYEIFDDLMVYQRIYDEGKIEAHEINELISRFPTLENIIIDNERVNFKVKCDEN